MTVGERGGDYPYLAEVVVELGKRGYDYTEEFEFGLDFILEGLERFRERSDPALARRRSSSSGPLNAPLSGAGARVPIMLGPCRRRGSDASPRMAP